MNPARLFALITPAVFLGCVLLPGCDLDELEPDGDTSAAGDVAGDSHAEDANGRAAADGGATDADDGDTVVGTDGFPAFCAPTCGPQTIDDDSPARAMARVPKTESDLAALLIVPNSAHESPDAQRLRIHLEGFGLLYKEVRVKHLSVDDIKAASTIILGHTSSQTLVLSSDQEAAIDAAISGGTDLLSFGPGSIASHPKRYGLTVQKIGETTDLGQTGIQWQAGGAQPPVFALGQETSARVTLAGATALATYVPSGSPAVTRYRSTATSGTVVMVGLNVLAYWGESEKTDAWARADLMFRVLAETQTRGWVRALPFPDASPGAFLMRVEDLSPGGTRFSRAWDDWTTRFKQLGDAMAKLGAPMHLGVVARYVDPTKGENFGWSDPDPARALLKKVIADRLALGAELICHGYTHQYGETDKDYTGVDWEFSDDASGQWTFLPFEVQKQRIQKARQTLHTEFGIWSQVWETPHLEGDSNTYKAAAEVGFKISNEADTNLFPNRYGEAGEKGDHILNVPHTGSYVLAETAASFGAVALASTLPRLTRIGAPFFFFYHGVNDAQAKAALDFTRCAAACNFWMPRVAEFAAWWQARAEREVWATMGPGYIHISVKGPTGLGLEIRLPDGRTSAEVRGAGLLLPAVSRWVGGVRTLRIVVPADVQDILVTYPVQ